MADFRELSLAAFTLHGISAADGVYTFEVPADGVIIFSSIGYKDFEITVNGKTIEADKTVYTLN